SARRAGRRLQGARRQGAEGAPGCDRPAVGETQRLRGLRHGQRRRCRVLQEVRQEGERMRAFLLFLSTALAQPMMVDPSKMSGIPRADPQVPAGTITVRLIRGELSNRVTNHPVELLA